MIEGKGEGYDEWTLASSKRGAKEARFYPVIDIPVILTEEVVKQLQLLRSHGFQVFVGEFGQDEVILKDSPLPTSTQRH